MNPLFSKFTAGGFQVGIYIHYLRGTQYFRPVAMGVDFKTLSLGYSSNQIEKAMETLRRRGIVVGNTRTVNPHICQHHLERKYTTLTGVLEVLALGIFQQKTVDARGHLVVDGPGRHFFFFTDDRRKWPCLDKAIEASSSNALRFCCSSWSRSRWCPRILTFLIISLPDSITEPNNFYLNVCSMRTRTRSQLGLDERRTGERERKSKRNVMYKIRPGPTLQSQPFFSAVSSNSPRSRYIWCSFRIAFSLLLKLDP